jgi:hypothetical protein
VVACVRGGACLCNKEGNGDDREGEFVASVVCDNLEEHEEWEDGVYIYFFVACGVTFVGLDVVGKGELHTNVRCNEDAFDVVPVGNVWCVYKRCDTKGK